MQTRVLNKKERYTTKLPGHDWYATSSLGLCNLQAYIFSRSRNTKNAKS